jgi:hypothetical protein
MRYRLSSRSPRRWTVGAPTSASRCLVRSSWICSPRCPTRGIRGGAGMAGLPTHRPGHRAGRAAGGRGGRQDVARRAAHGRDRRASGVAVRPPCATGARLARRRREEQRDPLCAKASSVVPECSAAGHDRRHAYPGRDRAADPRHAAPALPLAVTVFLRIRHYTWKHCVRRPIAASQPGRIETHSDATPLALVWTKTLSRIGFGTFDV